MNDIMTWLGEKARARIIEKREEEKDLREEKENENK